MFDDPRKELEQLEKKMLAAENDDWLDQQLAEAHALLGDIPNSSNVRNYANGYGQPQTAAQTAPQAAPQAAPRYVPQGAPKEPEIVEETTKKKKVDFLNILIIVELLGIAGLAGYWAIMLL